MSAWTVGGIEVLLEVEGPAGAYGVVVARGCTTQPSSGALAEALDAAVAEAAARPEGDPVTPAVRDLLRFGRYKPTGRGKPASEYLVKAAREGRFPRINNLVDINNLVSVTSRLPISLVDLGRAGTDRFVIRRGRAGEAYVFNATEQVIDVQDLLLVARLPADAPCANPVKDSMATKLTDASADVMAVLYGPAALAAEVAEATERFARALERWGGAREVSSAVESR